MKFDELNIDERILRAVEDMGFEETSPIQTQAIPAVLEGIDVIGQAQTGTGKTAAYSIPMLQKINPDVKKPQAIVLCPTRELAVQVAEEIRKLAKYMSDIKVLPVYGGQEIVRQIKSLKAGVQIIVGTPGRVMDHMRRKTVKFDSVSMVILDEADEMLDMGFREDMETILTETPEERQTVLFSATMPKPIMDIARKFQKDAKIIKVVRKELTVSNIDQFYYEEDGHKYLFYGSFTGIYVVELTDDGLAVKRDVDGNPVLKEKVCGNAFEGTNIYKKGNYYYLFASIGNCCASQNSTYEVVVGRSTSLLGPYVDKQGKKMLDNSWEPVVDGGDRTKWVGPGHNSVIIKDDAGTEWMIYHSYYYKEKGNKSTFAGRHGMLDRLQWTDDGWPYIKNYLPSESDLIPVFYK